MALQRLFGIKNDGAGGATAGQSYDDLTAGLVPDSDIFWPVISASFDHGITKIDRNDEVRARRQRSAPLPFRAAPKMSVKGRAYRSVIEKLLKNALGGADTVTGSASPRTHTLAALGFGSSYLQSCHAQLVRDVENVKMSGSIVKSLNFDFPLDGEGTWDLELWGLFYDYFGTAPPTATYSTLTEDALMLRDAEIFIDGSGTAIPDLQGFSFGIDNMPSDPRFYARQNVVTKTLGTPSLTRKLWFPREYIMKADVSFPYSIKFGNPNTAQEIAYDFGQIQKFVFDVIGAPIAGGNDMLRITIYGGAHTDGSTDDLTKDDDVQSSFSGEAFYSEADSAAVKVEIINANAAAIT